MKTAVNWEQRQKEKEKSTTTIDVSLTSDFRDKQERNIYNCVLVLLLYLTQHVDDELNVVVI